MLWNNVTSISISNLSYKVAEKSMIYETHNDSQFMKGVLIRR